MSAEEASGLVLIRARRVWRGLHAPAADALLVLGDRIIEVGDAAELTGRHPDATCVDYAGGCILPGFNDSHVHLAMMALNALGVDLTPEVTPTAEAFEAKLRHAPPTRDGWVRASRYDPTRTTGGITVTRRELDRLVPDRPAVVGHIGAHWGVANSAALAAAGIDETTPDPHGGTYGRDADGSLNGRMDEQAYFDFAYPALTGNPRVAPTPDPADAMDALASSVEVLLAAGITSITDAMMGPAELRLFQAGRDTGVLKVRVSALMTFPHLPALHAAGVADGFGDDWLKIGGIKAFADGAVAGRSCAVAEPFEGSTDQGILTTDLEALQTLAAECAAAGLTLALHANGERAITMALDALDALLTRGERVPRTRIEHCSIVTPEILDRVVRLGIGVAPFAGYATYHGDNLLAWYGPERLDRMFAHRWFLDSGVPTGGASDYPCGPLPPLLGIQSCVTRTSRTGRPAGLSQRISLEEALAIYTEGSAQLEGGGSRKGRLDPGLLADFVVLAQDPQTVDPARIADIPIVATWVGGRQQWAAVR